MRQRGLFADVVGLSLDTTGRRRQVFVVGELPVRFLRTSRRNAAKTLSGCHQAAHTRWAQRQHDSLRVHRSGCHRDHRSGTLLPRLR